MVLAAGGDGTHHALEAQCIELGLREVQVLVAPARLLAGHDLALAKTLLGGTHTFHGEHRCGQAAHVQHLANFFTRSGALALVVQLRQDLLDHGRIGLGAVLHHDGVVTLGAHAHVLHVRLGTGPPHTVDVLARVARGLGFFQQGGVHHTPAPVDDVVGAVAADLQPGGFLLHTGVGDRQQAQREPVHGGTFLQHRDRLFAERAVVVDQRDLLALEFVQAAGFVAQVLDDGVGGDPVGAGQREVPLEHATVGGFAAAVATGEQRNLVDRCFFRQREGDAGGQRLEHRGAAVLAFQAFVAFHAAVGGVAGFAFFQQGHHAVDAAAGIHQLHVIGHAVGEWHTVGCVGACAVDQGWEELLFGLRERSGGHQCRGQARGGDRDGEGQSTHFHFICLLEKTNTKNQHKNQRPVSSTRLRIERIGNVPIGIHP